MAGTPARTAVGAFLLALVTAGCSNGLTLEDARSGEALASVAVDVFMDDGVRCVTTPCPTESRSWVGRTDGEGRLKLPEVDSDWSLTVHVAGYRAKTLERRSGTLALEPVPAGQTAPPGEPFEGTLRASYVQMGHPRLGLTLFNRTDASMTWVRPRPDRFAHYEAWGGWNIEVTAGARRYHPMPVAGPYIAAIRDDLKTIEPGGLHHEDIDLGDWVVLPGTDGHRLRDHEGEVQVVVEWKGVPAHLKATDGAPAVSASTRLKIMPGAGGRWPPSATR